MVGRISSIRVRKLPIWLALTFFLSVFAGWASYPTGAQADTCHTSSYSVGDQATIMDLNGGCSYIGVRHKYDPVEYEHLLDGVARWIRGPVLDTTDARTIPC